MKIHLDEEIITDWRGVRILPGAAVIYGASVGRSIALVEAVVADRECTPTGAIRLRVLRRAYGGFLSTDRVTVGPDRLTVVGELPPATTPEDAGLWTSR